LGRIYIGAKSERFKAAPRTTCTTRPLKAAPVPSPSKLGEEEKKGGPDIRTALPLCNEL